MQVLIADDDAVSRRLLAKKLSGWGYEVRAARDGREAWEALQGPDAPRLAIMDWMMPGMTGPDLCRELRRPQSEPYTYVLLLTARTDKEDLIAGMDSGADDYLTKPFNAQELKVRLRAGHRILDLQSQLVAAREALREQATRDPLTCVWNRYAIFDTLSREVSRANREDSSLAVIMVDLDHFKAINDTYGHPAGDVVLREAARRMQACLRSYDFVGRYGGEEFLIVLPGSSGANAVELAERLRWALRTEPVAAWNQSIHTTASFGVTAIEKGASASVEDLIRIADVALYRAKQGRDRIEWCHMAANPLSTEIANLLAAASPPGSG
ncbi:MAG TPA: diguanylate cyclase [Bryobacteraceae bacterium]